MVWFSGIDALCFSALPVWFPFPAFIWFSSARTVDWLSSLVSGILFLSSTRFLVLLSASGFLISSKNFNFNSKFGRHSFSKNLFISKLMFSYKSYILVFAIATILSSD